MAEPEPKPEPELEQGEDDAVDPLAGLDEDARKLVVKANAEAAARRRELRAEREAREKAEQALAEHRRSQESETERLVREAEQRGYEKAAPLVLEADMALAASGRMRNPEDAGRLLAEHDREELLKMGDQGKRRERASALVAELLESRPYLALTEPERDNGPGLVRQGPRSTEPGPTAQDADAWLRNLGRER